MCEWSRRQKPVTGREVLFTEREEFNNLFYILNIWVSSGRGVWMRGENRHTSRNPIKKLDLSWGE